ncbi:hypothetical protein L6452_29154 [Arctium lappa]|uniref:Uncharacterized protein n=1 Tax=Arctium lappa TaxID=4217 RepID=A0ACB8ZGA0_ARCLA|nr:hypothetical protein L6452_29154 [Arctium lappa]
MASKLVLLGLLANLLVYTDAQSVGVCNGRIGNNLPSEQDVVTLYRNNGIKKMRIYDPNQATLRALKGTNIELILGVPNDALQSLTDQNAANRWVRDNIQNYPDVRFKYVAVGNEVDPNNESRRYVNFPHPTPPGKGAFRDNVRGFIEPIIKFLAQNNLPMLANIYPYFGYLGDPNANLRYALFTAPGTVVNDNGRQYSNLFDAMLDAHYAAQARLGGANVNIVVSETGWPSAGGRGASIENARTYYSNLIQHVKGTTGTPTKPGRSIETYLFAMFDENRKDGAETEKHFGIFYPNKQPKYRLSFN